MHPYGRGVCLSLLWSLFACDGTALDADDGFWADTHADEGSVQSSLSSAQRRVDINPGKVDDAEVVRQLPVGRSESTAARRVVLRLEPGELPQLARGDRLITPAEVQVTTRCDVGQVAAGCNYSPNVRAQLIVTGRVNDTSPSGNDSRAIATQEQTCTMAEHHCMFVFRPAAASLVLDDLPCLATGTCHVNLVMWAWSPLARADGDVVLVGGNDGDFLDNGRVEGDLARLMVVRERGISRDDRLVRETTGGSLLTVNTSAYPVLVYSHRLAPVGQRLQAGEQFLVEARVAADTASRARFSTELLLTRDPLATDGARVDEVFPSQVGEQNGFNCTGACVAHKVAVFRVEQAISDALYVNVVVKSAVPGGGSALVRVDRDGGWVRSVRYGPRLGGQ